MVERRTGSVRLWRGGEGSKRRSRMCLRVESVAWGRVEGGGMGGIVRVGWGAWGWVLCCGELGFRCERLVLRL